MFGFAVAVVFGSHGDKKLDIYSEEKYFALEIIFSLLMSFVLLANMYTMIVMSLTHFYVMRYTAIDNYQYAAAYLELHTNRRRYARDSFYIALFCFLCAIGIYLYPLLRLLSNILMISSLVIGGAIIMHAMQSMIDPDEDIKIYLATRAFKPELRLQNTISHVSSQAILENIREAE